jgi:ATP-dependent exoDNAse (exonuclease V) alpha subunit
MFRGEQERDTPMTIYHCSVKTGSRGGGANAVASDAYREGKKVEDEKLGVTHDYSRKQDVIESITVTPNNAPDNFKDSATLWNEVERVEKRKDARVFREVEVALPVELSHEENRKLTMNYVQSQFIDKGMCATVSFHQSKNQENPHAHIMLTTRKVDQEGFGQKDRSWDKKENVIEWRKEWANSLNDALEKNGIKERVDHRSYEDQGINQTPTIHLGKSAAAMERRGLASERGDINRSIERENYQERVRERVIDNGINRVDRLLNQHTAQAAKQAADAAQAAQQQAEQAAQQAAIEAHHRELHKQYIERLEREEAEKQREIDKQSWFQNKKDDDELCL